MGDKLKSCPFCGGKAEVIKSLSPWILCKKCGCDRHVRVGNHNKDMTEVIKVWNTRANPVTEEEIFNNINRIAIDANTIKGRKWIAKSIMNLIKGNK